jgi:hypothetical protein
MKNHFSILASTIICLGLLPAYSQSGSSGSAPNGPHLGGAMSKLFGDNQTFSAGIEVQTTVESNQCITLPGKLFFDAGKQRFEFNLSDIKGGQLPPDAAAQMKSLGLDENVAVARPDKNISYRIYPGLQSYIELPLPDSEHASNKSDFKVETAELGKETVDGHPCVKNKYVVTGNEGVKQEATVWNATDLKQFPVKIQTTERGDDVTMLFKNVSLTKPAASLFDPPAGFKKYDNIQQLMQQEMMKHMGGGMGMPPH